MTVSELIELLRQHSPGAVVALRYDCHKHGVVMCVGLRQGDLQAVRLNEVQSKPKWFDPYGGALLYELREDESGDVVDGLLLG